MCWTIDHCMTCVSVRMTAQARARDRKRVGPSRMTGDGGSRYAESGHKQSVKQIAVN